jgi:4-hydroxy-4-methyl-2-oxoglutarate aldolase
MSLAERLEALDSCVVSDALEALGGYGAVSGVVPMWECGRIAGPARTVLLRRLEPGASPAGGPHLGARTIEAGTAGDIVVVAHSGRSDSAGWGGLLSAAALHAGLRGCLVDGA